MVPAIAAIMMKKKTSLGQLSIDAVEPLPYLVILGYIPVLSGGPENTPVFFAR
jgi:hypothetical protein